MDPREDFQFREGPYRREQPSAALREEYEDVPHCDSGGRIRVPRSLLRTTGMGLRASCIGNHYPRRGGTIIERLADLAPLRRRQVVAASRMRSPPQQNIEREMNCTFTRLRFARHDYSQESEHIRHPSCRSARGTGNAQEHRHNI